MQTRWSLYNKEDKLRIDDLTQEQVKTILLAIPTSRMKDWYACRGGDIHWQLLSDLPEFYEDVRVIKGLTETMNMNEDGQPAQQPQQPSTQPPAQPSPTRRPLFEDMGGTNIPTLAIENVPTRERRSARRYQCKLQFRVIQGGKSFDTQTSDVSMAGMAINDALPPWIPKTFKAQIVNNGQIINLMLARIEKSDGKRMKIVDADSWDVLRRWIVSW